MITFNNIVTAFQTFTTNHFFLKTFSFGNTEEMDLPKYNDYPLLHLNYTGADYDEGTKTYNFEIFVLDLPSDKLDKVSYQREVISDSEQCVEDLLADVLNGGNIFTFADQYEVTSASVTPLEEETKNVLAGVLLTLAIEVPYQYDSCDAPLVGVTPTPAGDCPVAVVQNKDLTYEVNVASGATLVLPNISVTEVNGDTTNVPAQTDVTCAWTTLFVINSNDDILKTVGSYPITNRVALTDVAITEVNNTDTQVPAGDDYTCQWFDVTVKDQDDNTLGTITGYPSGGEFEVTIPTVTAYPQSIYHRKPSYSSISTGDYADLYANGTFDIWMPSVGVQMVQLGSDNYTLAANNRFGNTSRYTSTDGTASDTGTARFSSYGSGTSGVVRDNYLGIMWYNVPLGDSNTNWNSSQGEIDSLNTSSFAGFTDWIVPTRDMYSLSASPDNNEAIHTSPNLIIDSGTRRYMTCERIPYLNQGYFIFFSNGGETTQSLTGKASGKNRVLAARIMTLSELFG